MQVSFERFRAADGVELPGWFTDADGELAIVHVHGMSGNGYENFFLDNMRKAYTNAGLAFFTFDNRGTGVINHFRSSKGTKTGGSCFEIFEESIHDIQGAIDLLKSKGKSKFILQGHSLGGSKVVNYLLNNSANEVLGAVLLAPTDMVGWAKTEPKNQEYIDKAGQLIAQGRPEELVGPQCWLDKTPLSAQTYLSICLEGTAVDIYSPRESGSLISKVKVPMTIIYGDRDIAVEKIDGNINSWKDRVSKIINPKTDIQIIPGASHGFSGLEDQLAETSTAAIRKLNE